VKIRPGNDCNGLVTGHRTGNLIEQQLFDFLTGRTRPTAVVDITNPTDRSSAEADISARLLGAAMTTLFLPHHFLFKVYFGSEIFS
jgi:hypothetical protein